MASVTSFVAFKKRYPNGRFQLGWAKKITLGNSSSYKYSDHYNDGILIFLRLNGFPIDDVDYIIYLEGHGIMDVKLKSGPVYSTLCFDEFTETIRKITA